MARQALSELLGKAGIANVKLTYQKFEELFAAERFTRLRARGARVQRPLWASTGTKNPAYSDLLYIENLVAPETVNTIPPATLDALLDHGVIRPNSIDERFDDVLATMKALEAAQISLFDVTQRLQTEGVKSFADSYNALLAAIDEKRHELVAGKPSRVALDFGSSGVSIDGVLDDLGARPSSSTSSGRTTRRRGRRIRGMVRSSITRWDG